MRVLSGSSLELNTSAELLDNFFGLGAITAATTLFVIGHIIGLIMLGAAMWRAHVVPAWAGIVIIVSQPLHFVFAVIAPNHILDALAWGLAALGLAVAGLHVLRTGNDEWDLAPVARQ